ncbi:MAG: zinc ribbon domain-containing protein [Thermoleophilaceae bacterium]
MTPFAIFGITNDALNLAVNLLLLFLVVFWIALVYWTFADARRRISDPMLVGCATAASLFPFVGTVVYMIVRPPEFLEDVRERELEIAAAEARLATIDHHACPHCSNEVEKSYLRCPNCHKRLKEPCTTCGKPLDPRWSICPFCEAEVGQAAQQPARQRQRRRAPSSQTTQMPAREAPPRAPRAEDPARPAAGAPAAAAAPAASSAPAARPARTARQARPATGPDGQPRAERPPRSERPPAPEGGEPAPRRARPQV